MASDNTLLIGLGIAGAVGLSVWQPWKKPGAGDAAPTGAAATRPVALGNGLTWLPTTQEVVGIGPNSSRQLIASHVTTEAQARQVAARPATPGSRQQNVPSPVLTNRPATGTASGSSDRPATAAPARWTFYRSSDNRVWRADGSRLVYVSTPDELLNPDGTWKRILEGHGAEVDAQLRSQGIAVGRGAPGTGDRPATAAAAPGAAPPSVVNVPGSSPGPTEETTPAATVAPAPAPAQPSDPTRTGEYFSLDLGPSGMDGWARNFWRLSDGSLEADGEPYEVNPIVGDDTDDLGGGYAISVHLHANGDRVQYGEAWLIEE